jgi:hypothetical protein
LGKEVCDQKAYFALFSIQVDLVKGVVGKLVFVVSALKDR